jgi:hypothetical protein
MSTVNEIFKAAEDNINSILAVKANKYFRNLMEAAYVPEKKLLLPDGNPPYKPNGMHEAQVEPGIFWQIARKLDVFQRPEMKQVRREMQFIQALESLSAQDAEILLAIKDQKLHKKFKGLTLKKLTEIGYF